MFQLYYTPFRPSLPPRLRFSPVKCYTDVKQIFYGFVKVSLKNILHDRFVMYEKAFLMWVRHKKEKVNLVIYTRAKFSRALRWEVSTSHVSLIEPIILLCVQTEVSREGCLAKLHQLLVKSHLSSDLFV